MRTTSFTRDSAAFPAQHCREVPFVSATLNSHRDQRAPEPRPSMSVTSSDSELALRAVCDLPPSATLLKAPGIVYCRTCSRVSRSLFPPPEASGATGEHYGQCPSCASPSSTHQGSWLVPTRSHSLSVHSAGYFVCIPQAFISWKQGPCPSDRVLESEEE